MYSCNVKYINSKNGKVILDLGYNYYHANDFSEGLACVHKEVNRTYDKSVNIYSIQSKSGYIDEKGNIVYGNLGKVKKKQSTNEHSKAYKEYNKKHSDTYDDESYVSDYDNMTNEEFKEVYNKEMEHFSDWNNVDK